MSSPKLSEETIRRKLKSVFDETVDDDQVAADIAFHLTDWTNDLENLYEAYKDIEGQSNDQLLDLLYGFLAHVPNHLNAARKLSGMGKTEDIFKVGIFEDEP